MVMMFAFKSSFFLVFVCLFCCCCARGEEGGKAFDLPLQVTTENGMVEGFLDAGKGWSANTFLGIPFAAPPVGNLRFAAPVPPANYTLLKATAYADACWQLPLEIIGTPKMSEDCLYLNIFTPPTATGPLPVFFWIYGGDFIFGWTSDYPGGELSSTQDMIVVTISYRLSVLGFFALEEMVGTPLNAGLLDQQMALQWVYNNIAAFGGDPTKITIGGESAGGASTSFHLLFPSSWPYYRSAILESPGPWSFYNLTTQIDLSVAWAVKHGCQFNNGSMLACMRENWTPDLQDTINGMFQHFLPFVDGDLIVGQPGALYNAGKFKQVPILMGSNQYEGNFFAEIFLTDLPEIPVPNAIYDAAVNRTFFIFSKYVYEWYDEDRQTMGNWKAFANAVGDIALNCGAILLSNALATNSEYPVYRYFFTHTPTLWADRVLNATHITELPFVWNNPKILLIPLLTPEEQQLSKSMQTLWGNFVHNQNPSTSSSSASSVAVPNWIPFTTSDPVALILDVGTLGDFTTITNPKCDLWIPVLERGF